MVGVTSAAHLTSRENQVLELVAEGHTNRAIATALFISEKTVSVHITNIKTKLGVSTRMQVASVAARWGLTALGSPQSAKNKDSR